MIRALNQYLDKESLRLVEGPEAGLAYAEGVSSTSKPAAKVPSAEALRHEAVRRGVIEGLSTELLVALRTEIAAELDRRRGKGREDR